MHYQKENLRTGTHSKTLLMMSQLPVSLRFHETKTEDGDKTWHLIDRERENQLAGRTDEYKKSVKSARHS